MKVGLVIDNSANMSKQELIDCDVKKVVPISFVINGEEYYEGVNLTQDQFFAFMNDKNTEASTSQPSIEIVKETWREVLTTCDEIVYIILSSGLSASCNVAINASHEEEFIGRVFVVNNQRVSYLNKMAMYQAAELIRRGKSAEEIKNYLEDTKSEGGAYIAVDTLKFLKKGGRITPAAAAIGTLLNIKPILQLHGGKLDAYAKVMSMKQAKAKMINAVKKEIEDKFSEEAKQGMVSISVAHSVSEKNKKDLEVFMNEVKEAFADLPFFVCDSLPLFVSCHTGAGALAVGYVVDRLGILSK
ncbi:MAG: DegV family protein [Clostridia bacterium]|nr:DegV family protein [Clostridia bacterium]